MAALGVQAPMAGAMKNGSAAPLAGWQNDMASLPHWYFLDR